MKETKTETQVVIDASGAVVGRLASAVAKRLLKGETIAIINAEKALITGNPLVTKQEFHAKRARGSPQHGPFYPTQSHMILRRTIRGMLPYKRPRGRDAMRRLRVYIGSGDFGEGEKMARTLKTKSIALGELAVGMGGKC